MKLPDHLCSGLPGALAICVLLGLMVHFPAEARQPAGHPIKSTPDSAEFALLEPERAFQLSAILQGDRNVELRYRIADGYYMYKKRFRFAVEPTESVKQGNAIFSKGKMKRDPTFGLVEVYRDSVRILLPLKRVATQAGGADKRPWQLKVTSQGCADVGVCYPPFEQTVVLRPTGAEVLLPNGPSGSSSLTKMLQLSPDAITPVPGKLPTNPQ